MKSWLKWSFIIILVLAFSFWLYTHIEEYSKEVNRGYKGEARTNFLLAADYFLREMGQDTAQYNPYDSDQPMPNSNDTLLIPGQRLSLDARRSEKLMQWVSSGGHLILTAKAYNENDRRIRDHILDPLDIRVVWNTVDESVDEDSPEDLDRPDQDDFWLVDFINYQVLDIAEKAQVDLLWQITSKSGVHAVQLNHGEGLLTILSDMRMFRNHYIDQYGHSTFLWTLAEDQKNPGIFYYALYEEQMSLLAWLWQDSRLLMVSIILSLVIILWMLIPRFGPMIHIHLPVRRQFTEHLAAAGNFHWRQGHYASLLSESRQALLMTMQRKYPEWQSLSREQQLSRLAEMSGIDIEQVDKALLQSGLEKADDFIRRIKIIETLRKQL